MSLFNKSNKVNSIPQLDMSKKRIERDADELEAFRAEMELGNRVSQSDIDSTLNDVRFYIMMLEVAIPRMRWGRDGVIETSNNLDRWVRRIQGELDNRKLYYLEDGYYWKVQLGFDDK